MFRKKLNEEIDIEHLKLFIGFAWKEVNRSNRKPDIAAIDSYIDWIKEELYKK